MCIRDSSAGTENLIQTGITPLQEGNTKLLNEGAIPLQKGASDVYKRQDYDDGKR